MTPNFFIINKILSEEYMAKESLFLFGEFYVSKRN